MRLLVLGLIFISFSSCATKKPKSAGIVTIIKQWHTSPSTSTLDIEASRKMPQSVNQRDIYLSLDKLINKDIHITLLAEGCESGTEVNEDFPETFNGWNYQNLRASMDSENYEFILTMLPLKIKAKHPDHAFVLCADSDELLKKNQLAISDAKGFIGFYARLKQSELIDEKKFSLYHKALEESQGITIPYPIQYAKEKTIQALDNFKKYIGMRNDIFVQTIKNNINQNPIIIIGGLHVTDLVEKLNKANIQNHVLTPEGYPLSNETLIEDLRKELK